jgi:hypothetical protein
MRAASEEHRHLGAILILQDGQHRGDVGRRVVCAMLDAAKGVRPFKNSVKHRGEIAGRGIGGLKHLCQGRLAGQRFVALRGPRLELLPKCYYRLLQINVRVVGDRLLAPAVAPDDTLLPPRPASKDLLGARRPAEQMLPVLTSPRIPG